MSISDLLEEISIKAYEQPLVGLRDLPAWPALEDPLHVAMLFIDFDTEVSMQGLLGFLENSTGAFLDETIQLFQQIGAQLTADVLIRVREAMRRHGVTHQTLRAPLDQVQDFQLTSFAELHGPGLRDFATEVEELSRALYLHDRAAESPWPLCEAYLRRHLAYLQSELQRLGM